MPRGIDCGKVTFKYALGADFIEVLQTLHKPRPRLDEAVRVKGVEVAPRDVVAAADSPIRPRVGDRMKGRAIVGTWVIGRKDGKPREVYLYQKTVAEETLARPAACRPSAGRPASTRSSPWSCSRNGAWSGSGVLGPEQLRRAAVPRRPRSLGHPLGDGGARARGQRPDVAPWSPSASLAQLRRMHLVLIGLGGFAGAITRYLVDGWVVRATGGSFPWGTLVVNVSGSFLLGLLAAMTIDRATLPPEESAAPCSSASSAPTRRSRPTCSRAGGWSSLGLGRPRSPTWWVRSCSGWWPSSPGWRSGGRSEGVAHAHRRSGPAGETYIGEADHRLAGRYTRPSSSCCATAASPASRSCAGSRVSGPSPTCTRRASSGCRGPAHPD